MPSGGNINNLNGAAFINNWKKITIDSKRIRSKKEAITEAAIKSEIITIENLEEYNKYKNGNIYRFYIYKQQDNYTTQYNNYKLGLKIYNYLLCKNTEFLAPTITISSSKFTNIEQLYEDIKNDIALQVVEGTIPSLVCFNIQILYKYIFNSLKFESGYLKYTDNDNTNYATPNFNLIEDKIRFYIGECIPIYIPWGTITGELIHFMQRNINEGITDNLINFGPCYFDELFRLSFLIYRLTYKERADGYSNGQINLIQDSYNRNLLSDYTVFFLINEDDLENIYKFFLNYVHTLTIYSLPSTTFYEGKDPYYVNSENELIYTKDTEQNANFYNNDSEYKQFIDIIFNYYKKTLIFNNNDIIFNNVVLINIPKAESKDDEKNFKYAKAISKSFDIMKKHLYENRDTIENKYYIYVNNYKNYHAEAEFLKTVVDNLDSYPIFKNYHLLRNRKIIVSAQNNMEHTIRKFKQNPEISIDNIFGNLYFVSSYNLETNQDFKDLVENINSLDPNDPNQNDSHSNMTNQYYFSIKEYSPNSNLIKNFKSDSQVISYQKINLGILEANLINYLIMHLFLSNEQFSTYNRQFRSSLNEEALLKKISKGYSSNSDANKISDLWLAFKHLYFFYILPKDEQLSNKRVNFLNQILNKLLKNYMISADEAQNELINDYKQIQVNYLRGRRGNYNDFHKYRFNRKSRIIDYSLYTIDSEFKFTEVKLNFTPYYKPEPDSDQEFDVNLSFEFIDENNIAINYKNNKPIGYFEFNIDGITITDCTLGIVPQNSLMVCDIIPGGTSPNQSSDQLIIGSSKVERSAFATNDWGERLCELTIGNVNDFNISLENAVFLDDNGTKLFVNESNSLFYNFPTGSKFPNPHHEDSIIKNINLYYEFDTFDKLISSIFYENIILKNTTTTFSGSEYISYNLNNIIDENYSVIKVKYNDKPTFQQIFGRYDQCKIIISQISTSLQISCSGEVWTVSNEITTINELNTFELKLLGSTGSFDAELEINIPNIYHLNGPNITLNSNKVTIEVHLNNPI